MGGLVGALGHVFQALPDDPETLTHLLDAHHTAVVSITVARGGDIELELLVTRVWPRFPEIPFQTGSAQAWTGHAPLDGLSRRVGTDSLGAGLQDPVLHSDPVVFIEPLAIGEHVEDRRQGAHVLDEGTIEEQVAADPE